MYEQYAISATNVTSTLLLPTFIGPKFNTIGFERVSNCISI